MENYQVMSDHLQSNNQVDWVSWSIYNHQKQQALHQWLWLCPIKNTSHTLPLRYTYCAQKAIAIIGSTAPFTHSGRVQQANSNKTAATGTEPNTGQVSLTIKHSKLFLNMRKNWKYKDCFNQTRGVIRDETPTRENKTLFVVSVGGLRLWHASRWQHTLHHRCTCMG